MRLGAFVEQNIETILVEWQSFAKTRIPAAETMTVLELRDHAEPMLLAIAKDMRQAQSNAERDEKSKGSAKSSDGLLTPATSHGVLRHLSGFDLIQVASEFRALRATVLRLWGEQAGTLNGDDVGEVTRFNEGIDQAMAESIASYSDKIDESRDTFLAVLGHDLRDPLASLRNCLELLTNSTNADPSSKRVAPIARRSIASMEEMITHLLEYTRTRLGKGIKVRPTTANFGVLCEEVIAEVSAAHPQARFSYESTGDLSMRFDVQRLRQVLNNLFNNAVQHGDASSPIRVTTALEDRTVVLVVRNAGEPIPRDALQVIFNPLVQVIRGETEHHGRPSRSLGLGLFIAREILAAHGGTIAVESTEDAGTAFTVRLPTVGPV